MVQKPFVLSVRMIIQDNNGKCLLIRRSATNKSNVGKWEFPGGKIDIGEEFYGALLREVKEETGLIVNVKHIAGVVESEVPTVRIATLIFNGTIESGQIRLSNEHDAYAWVPTKEFSSYDLVEHLKTFLEEKNETQLKKLSRVN
jgi:8-oxo-dGTP diphosphatase